MSTEQNKATLARAVGRFNDPARREEYFDLYAEDAVLHGFGPEPLRGRAAAQAFYEMVWEALPDLVLSAEDLVAEGDRIVARYRIRGTHRGAFLGIAPTGARIDVGGMTLLRFTDGRVVERWQQLDDLGLLRQMGAVPA